MSKAKKMSVVLVAAMSLGIASSALLAEDIKDDRELLTTVSDYWRNHLLHDMRAGLFVQVQEILEASGNGDMATVEKLATARGKAHFAKMDPKMMAELPMGMKSMGKAMHLAFDDVAFAARTVGTSKAVASAVSDLMSACTACHSTYKLNK